jgi:hypothetical protein
LKKYVLLTVLFFTLFCLSAQIYTWDWATSAGGASYDRGEAIATDNNGNTYVTGQFKGTATFGSYTLTSVDSDEDIFVVKINNIGIVQWAVSAGGTNSDYGYGIDVDYASNVYLTGQFRGTATFGLTTLVSNGDYSDAFVAKLTRNGDFQWAVRVGGPSSDMGKGIAVDGLGNIYIYGSYLQTATFGSITLSSSGWGNIYVAKLNSGGNFLWAVSGGAIAQDHTYAYGLALDSAGNIYLTGNFMGTAIFGATTLISSGSGDIYAAKLDNTGNFLWAIQAGGTDMDYANGIAVDDSANIYLTGFFGGTATFGPTTFTSLGENDIYVSKLDSLGNFLWTARAGGIGIDLSYSIAVDDSANAYLTGAFYVTANFGSYQLSSSGLSDIYVAKLDSSGIFQWAVRAGEASNNDIGYSIAVDHLANLYITGNFNQEFSFGTHPISSNGLYDIFVAKYSSGYVAADDALAPVVSGSARLLYNFPNPFNAETVIKYNLDKDQAVQIEVYNLKGQLTKTIFSGIKSSGNHSVEWTGDDNNGRFVSNGIYLVKLKTSNTISTMKMVMVK